MYAYSSKKTKIKVATKLVGREKVAMSDLNCMDWKVISELVLYFDYYER